MASPVAHIIYGEKIFRRIKEKLNWDEFVVGTLFPDIRYPAGLNRDTTHTYNTSETLIPSDNSFKAGMYVHSLVDEKRMNYSHKSGLSDEKAENILFVTASKYVEDRLLYGERKDWRSVAECLNNLHPEESGYVRDDSIVKDWHLVLRNYLSEGPTITAVRRMMKEVGQPDCAAEEVCGYMNAIENDGNSISVLRSIINLF